MTPSEAYQKYEFLDYLLSDREWLRGGQGAIMFDLWQAVKTAVIQPGSIDWMVTEIAAGLGIPRDKFASMVIALQVAAMVAENQE